MPANEFTATVLEDAVAAAAASLGMPAGKIKYTVVHEVRNPDPDLCEVTIRVNNARRVEGEDTLAQRLARSLAEKRAAQEPAPPPPAPRAARPERAAAPKPAALDRRVSAAVEMEDDEDDGAPVKSAPPPREKRERPAPRPRDDFEGDEGGDEGEGANQRFTEPAPEDIEWTELGERAKELMTGVVARMNFAVQVEVIESKTQLIVRLSGDDAGLLAGRKGYVAASFQFILNKVINRKPGERKRIYVDVRGEEPKKEREESDLDGLAAHLAQKAVDIGKPLSIAPMNPRDRRAIHLALQNNREVATRSDGNGSQRTLQIVPRRRAQRHDSHD